MKTRLPALILFCAFGLVAGALGQTPVKSGDKAAEKKAPAPKTPADLAFDEFNKVRNEAGAKDHARFQRVIAAGLDFLTQYPTHARVNDAVRDLAFYGVTIDKKQPALRTSYLSLLRLEVANLRYKEGVTEPAKAALAAVEAAAADYEVREAFNRDTLAALREKIDALAETPGGARFLVDRERSYAHVLALGPGMGRAEEQLKKLRAHPEKPVATMAQEELVIFDAKKEPLALTFTALDGKEVDFAQLRGKVVALYFWSAANKGSVDRFEALKRVYGDYRKRGFEVVTVSYDKEEDRAKLVQAIKDNRIAWPVYFDGKGAKGDFATKLNATSVPRLYLFDQKGLLQTTVQGSQMARLSPDIPQNMLESIVKKLLGVK